jgi:hypothetical protein
LESEVGRHQSFLARQLVALATFEVHCVPEKWARN